jgi:5-methylcytosine-specific restriction endonuclease McrA
MKKALRQQVYEKYSGLCAYTGKPLGDDWQVDHMTSRIKHRFNVSIGNRDRAHYAERLKEVDCIENLVPSLRIINHYKRSWDLEGFRNFMKTFHKRLAKLPKKTMVEHTKRRIAYMNEVADLFGITPEKPFDGKFYFEKL